MTQNFFVLCKGDDGLHVKRVPMNQETSNQTKELFNAQHAQFMHEVDERTLFDGGWNPDDPKDVLYVDGLSSVNALLAELSQNTVSMPKLDLSSFQNEKIVALLTKVIKNEKTFLLIQRFQGRQKLDSKRTLVFDSNHFNKITGDGFIVANGLTCVVEGTTLLFRSFHSTRTIFDLSEIYTEATNEHIDEFANEQSPLSIADTEAFKQDIADQTIRKLIYSVYSKRNISQYTSDEITRKANHHNIQVERDETGCIIVPQDRKKAKELLYFLDDKLYEAPLSGKSYVSNSSKERSRSAA